MNDSKARKVESRTEDESSLLEECRLEPCHRERKDGQFLYSTPYYAPGVHLLLGGQAEGGENRSGACIEAFTYPRSSHVL